MTQFEIAMALIGAALVLGFALGYSYSGRHRGSPRRHFRNDVPLHTSPRLVPESGEETPNYSSEPETEELELRSTRHRFRTLEFVTLGPGRAREGLPPPPFYVISTSQTNHPASTSTE